MLNKVLEENHCSVDMRLAWCVNINNSLQNFNGFSRFQLEIGENPYLHHAATGKPSPLLQIQTSKILR